MPSTKVVWPTSHNLSVDEGQNRREPKSNDYEKSYMKKRIEEKHSMKKRIEVKRSMKERIEKKRSMKEPSTNERKTA